MSKQMSDLMLANYHQLESWYGERHDNIVPLSRHSSASGEHQLVELLQGLKPGCVTKLSGAPDSQRLAMYAAYRIGMKDYGMPIIIWTPDNEAEEISMLLLSVGAEVGIESLRTGSICGTIIAGVLNLLIMVKTGWKEFRGSGGMVDI